jgi:hypothetical protein
VEVEPPLGQMRSHPPRRTRSARPPRTRQKSGRGRSTPTHDDAAQPPDYQLRSRCWTWRPDRSATARERCAVRLRDCALAFRLSTGGCSVTGRTWAAMVQEVNRCPGQLR